MNATAPKTIVLTGASRGIGHVTVGYFAARGWRVICCSREAPPPSCPRDPAQGIHIAADLSKPEDVDRFIKQANDVLGDDPLHALVNNAGVSPKTPYKERLGCLNGDIAAWRDVFELNFFTPLTLSRGFASALHRGKGAICNITSIAGHYVHPFAGSAYSTSKAALSGLTREMAVEFAELGVRVNAVAPGEIKTAMISPEYEALVPRIPMNRMGTPEDVAAAVLYLVGEDSSYVTGTEIFVTGGQHLY
ncbi:SDR family NAD(P)-dependent oxidoreductase [Thalassospira alkalitolerans]|uniref:Oxidoreductase n=1 Tax=Thalassospira alkalitolerans TaxID=1293890 RepID=A0A1Y2LBD3_9PROT|nr:SDR family oxidoreductase [Thalassospira alkalitolerans]OSQ47998.1 oxidoreductase [Thalassospira alkalitolerans]|tara:strand:- start:65502 stop:66245 length:744 start_codon:yes stop_codon:yes gene_type:complete